MSTSVLTPDQWRTWREKGQLLLRYPEGRGRYHLAGREDGEVRFHGALSDPDEFRAAIAVLLDALAQKGEPVLTEVHAALCEDAAGKYDDICMLARAGSMHHLSRRIASFLPPSEESR